MLRDVSSVCLSLSLRERHSGIAGSNRSLREIHIREPPILLSENHRSVEPPHLVDPFDDVVVLEYADAFRFYTFVAFLFSFRGPTGAGAVFDVKYTQRLAQDDFTKARRLGGSCWRRAQAQ